MNVTAVSSTSTSISLKWVATDDRVYYYSADMRYSVLYHMNNITYVLFVSTETIAVTGLKPDTEYTFSIKAGVKGDIVLGPTSKLTYHTRAAGECDSAEDCIAQCTVFMSLNGCIYKIIIK